MYFVMQADVYIIGAGLSGLCCAKELSKRNISWCILEASDRVGGRVATDNVEGFLLDRGFQVLLDAYPETQRVLDYQALDLRRFSAGARVWLGGNFTTVMNPLEHPSTLFSTLFSPIGSLRDKLSILGLRQRVVRASLEELFARPEQSTHEALLAHGFSQTMIERFFTPFFGGIFLDRSLQTSSRMFDFVFKMFSQGHATLPAQGMAAIAEQLAHGLPAERVRLQSRVAALRSADQTTTITLETGEEFAAKTLVVATDAPNAARLLSSVAGNALQTPAACATTCLYFAAPQPPYSEPLLVLNGTNTGLVNNLCVQSNVTPHYAPQGQALISVSLKSGDPHAGLAAAVDEDELVSTVRTELSAWYGAQVQQWRHLRTYTIPYALPNQHPPALLLPERPVQVRQGVYVCGDHRDTASIHGAMVSGRRTAEALAAAL
jgi:protoporphyrinogen oxidase